VFGHGHGGTFSRNNSECQLNLATLSTVLDLLLSKEAFTLLSLGSGGSLVNERELSRYLILTVGQKVSNVDKSSADVVHRASFLRMADVELQSISDGQNDLNLVSRRLPGRVAAVVNDGSLGQEGALAAGLLELNTRVRRLMLVKWVFDSHTTLDVHH